MQDLTMLNEDMFNTLFPPLWRINVCYKNKKVKNAVKEFESP